MRLTKTQRFTRLGTSIRFEIHRHPSHSHRVVFGFSAEVEKTDVRGRTFRVTDRFRIAVDEFEQTTWRLDVAGSFGLIWEAMLPTKFTSPELAAQALVSHLEQVGCSVVVAG